MQERLWYRGNIVHRFDEQGGLCFYCKRQIFLIGNGRHPLFATLDHKYPYSKGGRRTTDNVVAACGQCNAVKGDRTADRFLELMEKHGSDIHKLTEMLWGTRRMNKWKSMLSYPIPEQPPRTTVTGAPAPAWKIDKREFVISDPWGPFTLHVYDLKNHTSFEEMFVFRQTALRRGKLHAQRDFKRFIVKVTPTLGSIQYLYFNESGGIWVWAYPDPGSKMNYLTGKGVKEFEEEDLNGEA